MLKTRDFDVHTNVEQKRGCGYRKPSADGVGLYLVGDGIFAPCNRLPFPLTVCPCCGAGIKPSRGFTWIFPQTLFDPEIEPKPSCDDGCIMCQPHLAGERAGLMWVGSKYYSPHSFIREAQSRGVSKKIAAVPNGFEMGKHFIYLAHRQAVYDWDNPENPSKPGTGIFMAFKPTRVDLVVDDPLAIPERAKYLKKKLGDKAQILTVKKAEDLQGSMFEVEENGKLSR